MRNRNWIALLVLLVTAGFYIFTLSPSLAWGDGVKLQSEVISGESFVLTEMTAGEFSPDPYPFAKVGVAAWDHPLYIMLGHLLVRAFPFVDSLRLVNLISGMFGALSVMLVFLLCHQFTSSTFASGFAALSLAVSHTFWWHSVTPEVYTLFVFLFLSGFYFFDQHERSGKPSALAYGGFFWGLSASNHILAFLALPALGLSYLLSKNRRSWLRAGGIKKTIPALAGFLAGFSIYLVQFIRVSGNIPLKELAGPAVGSTFLNRLGTFSPAILAESLITYLLFLLFQFGPLGVMLGALGIRRSFSGATPSLHKVFSFYIVFTLFGIFYRVTDQFAFFLTSHVFFALLMAIGGHHLLVSLKEQARFILTRVLILTLLLTPPFYHSIPRLAERYGVDDSFLKIPQIGTGVRNGFAYYIDPYKRGDFNAHRFGFETITNLAPHAVVIAEWYTDTDEYFILRYFTRVEGLRPDVTIHGFPTRDPFSFDSHLVLDVIAESIPDHPVYLASLSDAFYASSALIEAYCIVPENNLFRLDQKGESAVACLGADSVTE